MDKKDKPTNKQEQNSTKPDNRAKEVEYTAVLPNLVDIVIDAQGSVKFLFKSQDGKLTVSDSLMEGERELRPPRKSAIPFALPRAAEVLRWYREDDDQQLFIGLLAYLRRYSHLEEGQWLIVACTAILSYIQDHEDVYYLPILLFWAAPERGKSRTGKAVTLVSYRGIHLLDLREANLFRYSHNMKSTIFFDIMDFWNKAQRGSSEDILLGRYEKGAKVARVLHPEKGAFKDMQHFEVYGSTIIATNSPVHKILGTRCIPITMPNRPGVYEQSNQKAAQALKERLTAWRAKMMGTRILDREPVPAISGRLWDISKPLFQICRLICPENEALLERTLIGLSGERIEDKQDTIEGEVISILKSIAEQNPKQVTWDIPTSTIVEMLNIDRSEAYRVTSRSLGKRLSALGVRKRKGNGGMSIRIVDRPTLDALVNEYGLGPPEANAPNSLNSLGVEETSTYNEECYGELEEDQANALQTLQRQPLENKGSGEFGEFGAFGAFVPRRGMCTTCTKADCDPLEINKLKCGGPH